MSTMAFVRCIELVHMRCLLARNILNSIRYLVEGYLAFSRHFTVRHEHCLSCPHIVQNCVTKIRYFGPEPPSGFLPSETLRQAQHTLCCGRALKICVEGIIDIASIRLAYLNRSFWMLDMRFGDLFGLQRYNDTMSYHLFRRKLGLKTLL